VELPAGLVFDGVRQQFYDGAGYRRALGAIAEVAYGPAAAAAWLRATGHWGPWHRAPAAVAPGPIADRWPGSGRPPPVRREQRVDDVWVEPPGAAVFSQSWRALPVGGRGLGEDEA
jgi:hypothetical protein